MTNYDFDGNLIFIYDEEGTRIMRTTVIGHDKVEMRVRLEEWPTKLKTGDLCRLLILSEPTPCEYSGRARDEFGDKYIALFRGKEKESRKSMRYEVNFKATIEALIYEKQEYDMLESIDVELLNISSGGMRFRSKVNTINEGDKFKATMTINDTTKTLFCKIVNITDVDGKYLDYGCNFFLHTEDN